MVYMKEMKAIITTFIEYICHLSKYTKGKMVKLAGTFKLYALQHIIPSKCYKMILTLIFYFRYRYIYKYLYLYEKLQFRCIQCLYQEGTHWGIVFFVLTQKLYLTSKVTNYNCLHWIRLAASLHLVERCNNKIK